MVTIYLDNVEDGAFQDEIQDVLDELYGPEIFHVLTFADAAEVYPGVTFKARTFSTPDGRPIGVQPEAARMAIEAIYAEDEDVRDSVFDGHDMAEYIDHMRLSGYTGSLARF